MSYLIDLYVCIIFMLITNLLTIGSYANEIVLDRFKMDDKGVNRNQSCAIGLYICQSQPCGCKRSERTAQFLRLLNHLTVASTATDYKEQIFATVATICAVCIQFNLY
jgi:hypothetical protein